MTRVVLKDPVVCTSRDCDNEARIAIKTDRPTRPGLKSTVYFDDRAAPKRGYLPYCRACGSELLRDLVLQLVPYDEAFNKNGT